MNWHTVTIEAIVKQLQTDPLQGLTPAEAQHRLVQHGANELTTEERASPIALFLRPSSRTR